jgi:two-component system sensor histidine kinase AgrC
MHISTYQIFYLISNIMGTYIIYCYMNIFFDTTRIKKSRSILIYTIYYLVTVVIYLFFNIPILMLFTNLALFFLISLNYSLNVKKCILSSVFIYIILMVIEMVIVVIYGYMQLPVFTDISNIFTKQFYSTLLGTFTIQLVSYTVCMLIRNYRNVSPNNQVPTLYWFCIILMPLVSIYISILLCLSAIFEMIYTVIGLVLLFIINFSTFYLYEKLAMMYKDKMEKVFLEQENKYYNNQFELIQTSLKSVKSFKHDLLNHLSAIKILIQKDEKEKVLDHIVKMTDSCYVIKEYAKSGNIVIDSMINFKLQQAEEDNIKINVVLKIPPNLNITSFDLVIILGNILDNAIHATKKLGSHRNIDLRMSYNKGRLIIKLENTFDGKILFDGDKILSIDKNNDEHGLGIGNVKRCIKNYNGTMDIEITEKLYTISLLLYIPN